MPSRIFRLGDVLTDTVADLQTGLALITATGRYMTFETPQGTDYTVAGSVTLYIGKIQVRGTAAATAFEIGYGDDGVADGVAAPTNPVIISKIFYVLTTNVEQEFNVVLEVPTGKLPFAHTTVNGGVDIAFYGAEF